MFLQKHSQFICVAGGRRSSDKRLLTHEDIKRVVNFLVNYAETHAIDLPGRTPGFRRFDVKLLPSHETKASIWSKYTAAMETLGMFLINVKPIFF